MTGLRSIRMTGPAPDSVWIGLRQETSDLNLLIYLLAFLVLTIGNCELLVTAVNRVHSRPIREFFLRQLRHAHDLLIPLFPAWLLIGIGGIAPGVLFQDIEPAVTWSLLPFAVQLYFVCCGLGFIGFAMSVARYHLNQVPRQQIGFLSRVINIADELGAPPVANGPFRSMTRIPGNECFSIELNERVLELDRLPADLDGIRILHLTDLHFIGTIDLPYYERVLGHVALQKFDLAVFTGDLLDGLQFTDWIPKTLGKVEARIGRYAILGNHDWNLPTAQVRDAMTAAGWIDVASRCEVLSVGNAEIAIGGNETPWMGVAPSFADQPQSVFRLALSHSPDNINWARRERVDLMLSGHNHGGQVVLPGIGPVYSPSIYGCRFAGGLYWLDPTLLVVSRGVSGRHPLRIGCKPEISILELRQAGKRK